MYIIAVTDRIVKDKGEGGGLKNSTYKTKKTIRQRFSEVV
jgi:hypothetical protein